MPWTTEQVLALAPDEGSVKAGFSVAAARKWEVLGQDGHVAWGLCLGSGKSPYQTCVELAAPAFKCSCPSRKFPCKHGLGLLLLLVRQPGAFTEESPPQWVQEWLAARQQRAEKRKQQGTDAVPDMGAPARREADQARRAARREERVADGVAELERWLHDLVRQGFAAAQSQGYSFWEQPAARLTDAQAPGVRRLVLHMATVPASGPGWQAELLDCVGRLYLLLRAYQHVGQLAPATQADVRTCCGWTMEKAEVLAQPGLRDRWAVLGQYAFADEIEDNLRVQRTWLWGANSQRSALLLQFAFGREPFEPAPQPGMELEATLAFFPGAFPVRALVKVAHRNAAPLQAMPGYATLTEALRACGAALAAMPWLMEFLVPARGVTPELRDDRCLLRDSEGRTLPLLPSYARAWELVALSGGHPLDMAGEWDGRYFLPLSIFSEGRWVLMPPREGAGEH